MDFDQGSIPSSPSDDSISSVEEQSTITISVHPTTGGQFEIEISPEETAEELRRKISRRLQTPKERLKVLHKEPILEGKPLKDYNIVDGSRVTLLPAVESGFSSTVQGTQQSIIQAIESLSDPQIDDFLSGRLPLTLALRVGDHMMFVQLQLEQSQLSNQNSSSSRSHHGHPTTSQQNHPLASTATCIPSRIFPDMHNLGGIPAALAATALLPKTAATEFASKKSPGRSSSSSMSDSNIAGPVPKVPKLALRTGSERRSGNHFAKEDPSTTTGIVYKPEQFLHDTHPLSLSPEALTHPMFDPNLYHEIASHVNHHSQQNASHLHKLATACSSLGQVMAVPPSASSQLKVPAIQDHHKVKSSRKRPSTLAPPEFDTASSSSSKASPMDVGTSSPLPSPTAIIQNALLRQQHFTSFPPLPSSAALSPSAYAKLKASTKPQGPLATNSAPTTPTSTPAEIRLRHPITSNMLQACGPHPSGLGPGTSSSSGAKSDKSQHHGHRRSSTTSGKITSSAISAHHSGSSGTRVARQMQRLRRLCASHQQCVAYSNRELATEISSIVHMAKHSHHHHSRSEGSSYRKSHKSCRDCRGRDRNSGSHSTGAPSKSSAAGSQSASGNSGASIDSFTTHGPGIFSGTFSGSLHPSIQDHDGKPKRDPKTILQILTDLLNATQQYQGQLGNVGLLPQLFKDHFKGESAIEEDSNKSGKDVTKPEVLAPATESDRSHTENKMQKEILDKKSSEPEQSTAATSPTKQTAPTPRPVYRKPYVLLPSSFLKMSQSPQNQNKPMATSYLSSVSTIPIGNIPPAYPSRDDHMTSSHSRSRKGSPSSGQESHSRHHHHHYHHHSGRCHHHRHHHSNGTEKSGCSSSSSRRQAKSHMLNSTYVKRLKQLQHENTNTRNKMKELKVMMETQRRRRQCRRNASKLYNRRNAVETSDDHVTVPLTQAGSTIPNSDGAGRSAEKREMNGGKMEVQFDDIQFEEIKEVTHEPPETVTV